MSWFFLNQCNMLVMYYINIQPARTLKFMETGRKEMFYLMTHSTHFIYGYMASDIWLRTILIVRKETCCRHIGYYFWLTARVLLYASSHRQDSTYHSLCYTSRGALAGTRNIMETEALWTYLVYHSQPCQTPLFLASKIITTITINNNK